MKFHFSRSSHRRCSMKNVVLENFAKSIGKHLCQSLFFNKVAGLWPVITWKHKMCSKVTTKNSKLQQKKCSAIAIIYDFHNFTEQNLIILVSLVLTLTCVRVWDIWDKVFKNKPSKICGREPLKNLN